jgi:hypothetical protein
MTISSPDMVAGVRECHHSGIDGRQVTGDDGDLDGCKSSLVLER